MQPKATRAPTAAPATPTGALSTIVTVALRLRHGQDCSSGSPTRSTPLDPGAADEPRALASTAGHSRAAIAASIAIGACAHMLMHPPAAARPAHRRGEAALSGIPLLLKITS
eukprot:SAG31_NODE_3910_length_3762_cov_2.592684_1_plen_112_part_00